MDFKEAIYNQYISFHNEHLYGKSSLEKFKNHFSINEFYLGRFLPRSLASKILDIGCGDGSLVYWLQQKGFANAHGVDISNEQITMGRELGITGLQVGDLSTYLTNQVNLDFVIARDVFEHFTRQDFFDALKLIKKALKEDATLLLQVPNGQGIYHTSILYGDITHEMAYTANSLRQLILAAGFTSIEVYPVDPYSKGIKGILRTLLWKIKVYHHRFWKKIETGNSTGIFTSNLIASIK